MMFMFLLVLVVVEIMSFAFWRIFVFFLVLVVRLRCSGFVITVRASGTITWYLLWLVVVIPGNEVLAELSLNASSLRIRVVVPSRSM